MVPGKEKLKLDQFFLFNTFLSMLTCDVEVDIRCIKFNAVSI